MLKIPFFRLGVWKHPKYGELRIDQPMLDRLLANFRSGLPGSVPYVRLGHDKDAAEVKATFGDTPALAWVKDLVQEGPVVYGLADPAHPQVAEWIRSKRYRYASAEYEPNHVSRETGQPVGPVLSAIALTNEPFLTRLPEAVVLAAPADQFYIDCEEVKRKMKFPELMKKLAAMAGIGDAEIEDLPIVQPAASPAPVPAPAAVILPADVQAKLAEHEQLKVQLAAQAEEQTRQAAALVVEQKARREAEVNQLAAALVAEGIPPAQIEEVRPLLLADTGTAVGKIKLAAGGEKDATQTDLIVRSLRALPENQRVKFGQAGAQDDGDVVAKLAKTAQEDVIALGGTVTADGKFKL